MKTHAPGTFLVIEGTDGSGKSTQYDLLVARLQKEGYDVATFKFPRYDEPSSYFVKQYLNGEYGSAEEVGPYTASLFYALDRFAAAPQIQEALNSGKVVLVDRYAGSNMAHQGTKFAHDEERRGFFIWLDNLEFELLGSPRPDMSFVLRVPVETSLKLLETHRERTYTDKKLDIHEADKSHLERALTVYDDMCRLFPKDFTRIECTYRGQLLPVETIHEIVWRQVEPFLPHRPAHPSSLPAVAAAEPVAEVTAHAQSAPELPAAPSEAAAADTPPEVPPIFFTPETLAEPVKRQYHAHLTRILELQRKIQLTLETHLAKNGAPNAGDEAARIARAVMPLAAHAAGHGELLQGALARTLTPKTKALAESYRPRAHAALSKTTVQLVRALPRNELDAVADLIYPFDTAAFTEISADVATWPYERKAAILESRVQEAGHAGETLRYTWDIVSDIAHWADVAAELPGTAHNQPFTPRYGYRVPEILEEAGAAEQFEACFDISLGLYSLLQESGEPEAAQYACLLGHMQRWSLTLSAAQLHTLAKTLAGNALVRALHEQAASVHPISTTPLA